MTGKEVRITVEVVQSGFASTKAASTRNFRELYVRCRRDKMAKTAKEIRDELDSLEQESRRLADVLLDPSRKWRTGKVPEAQAALIRLNKKANELEAQLGPRPVTATHAQKK